VYKHVHVHRFGLCWQPEGGKAMFVADGDTLAEGVRVRDPARGVAVCEAVLASQGFMCVVDEKDIMPARDELARLGFLC